jgi:hypothetical protein
MALISFFVAKSFLAGSAPRTDEAAGGLGHRSANKTQTLE